MNPLKSSDQKTSCPFDYKNCPVLYEVDRLKKEISRLKELSQTDSLTGIFNYRYLLKALNMEMERTRRTGLPTALIMIDLDHFKYINDTHGHGAGNKALKWASDIFCKNIRNIDIPCRYGGEEFAIILPGTRLPQGARAAERLRASLEGSPVKLNDRRVNLSASFGVDIYSYTERLSIENFIKRTDSFLLKAKQEGRNCVRFREPEGEKLPAEVSAKEREALFTMESEREGDNR